MFRRHSSREHYTPTLLPKKLKELKEREDLDRLVAKKIEEGPLFPILFIHHLGSKKLNTK
jgi:hypothetical protein